MVRRTLEALPKGRGGLTVAKVGSGLNGSFGHGPPRKATKTNHGTRSLPRGNRETARKPSGRISGSGVEAARTRRPAANAALGLRFQSR
jgi:hypothetical protein